MGKNAIRIKKSTNKTILFLSAFCFVIGIFAKTDSEDIGDSFLIASPSLSSIKTPTAGVYPQGMFKFDHGLYKETLEWYPKITDTFKPNTVYTAAITFEPKNKNRTFKGVQQSNIGGLPSVNNISSLTTNVVGDNLVITITYKLGCKKYYK